MVTPLTAQKLRTLCQTFGDCFYILDSDVFENNYHALTAAFKAYYPHFNIAYSYKTNYLPRLAQTADRLGSLAEVVSFMEAEIALRSGVSPKHILWNGPLKHTAAVHQLLLDGGTINVDTLDELKNLLPFFKQHPSNRFSVGVRCNYDVGDGVLSRFGIDVTSPDFDEALRLLAQTPNATLTVLHAHFAKRNPQFWQARTRGMLECYARAQQYGHTPRYIDIGGGIYGPMPASLRQQLHIEDISYADYAAASAKEVAAYFKNAPHKPCLLVEPGSALAGNVMRFVCRVTSIKTIRGKTIATLNGSQKNISMNGINPPMEIIAGGQPPQTYTQADLVGFTCIEGDVLYHNYSGPLAVGDYVVFHNCGSYSVVMKPPFILPNVAVVDISKSTPVLVKCAETVDDIVQTFVFK